MSSAPPPEWLAALGERLQATPVGEIGGQRLRLGLRLTDPDGGSRSFTAVIGGGEPGELLEGERGAPEVVLVESAETAARLAAGASIADELAAGRVKLEGDVSRLLTAERELSALASLLGGAG